MKSLYVVFAFEQSLAAICECLTSNLPSAKDVWLLVLLERSIKVGPGKAGQLESRFQDMFGAWLLADIIAVREDRAIALSCFVNR
jgi:hypothetical protein